MSSAPTTPAIDIDERRWPLLLVTLYRTATDAEYKTFLERLSAITRRRVPHAVVMDLTHGASPTPNQRKLHAHWIKSHEADLAVCALGVAFVFSSVLVRFALSSFLLLQTLPSPYAVCATLDEGITWALDRIPKP